MISLSFIHHYLLLLQAQHTLQDPGAGEASYGAQRLHDQPRPTRQPAWPAAQPRTHCITQPEATHTQVDKKRDSHIQTSFSKCDLFFSASYDYELDIFGFWVVGPCSDRQQHCIKKKKTQAHPLYFKNKLDHCIDAAEVLTLRAQVKLQVHLAKKTEPDFSFAASRTHCVVVTE